MSPRPSRGTEVCRDLAVSTDGLGCGRARPCPGADRTVHLRAVADREAVADQRCPSHGAFTEDSYPHRWARSRLATDFRRIA